jgi:hypothetical protein
VCQGEGKGGAGRGVYREREREKREMWGGLITLSIHRINSNWDSCITQGNSNDTSTLENHAASPMPLLRPRESTQDKRVQKAKGIITTALFLSAKYLKPKCTIEQENNLWYILKCNISQQEEKIKHYNLHHHGWTSQLAVWKKSGMKENPQQYSQLYGVQVQAKVTSVVRRLDICYFWGITLGGELEGFRVVGTGHILSAGCTCVLFWEKSSSCTFGKFI